MRVEVVQVSDVGRVREGNEDSSLHRVDPSRARGDLLIVADGMGGAAAGEVASRLAVDTVAEVYFASMKPPSEALGDAVHEANARIHAASLNAAETNGMGTTCTALAVVEDKIYLAHVGDSRAYRIRSSSLERLTRDHSLWADQVRRGASPASESGRNQLTAAVGLDPELELEAELVRELDAREGDRLLLCSDGLWGLVTDPEIRSLAGSGDLKDACRRLVALANRRGGHDNVTIVLAELNR